MRNPYKLTQKQIEGNFGLEDVVKYFIFPGWTIAIYHQIRKIEDHPASKIPKWKLYGRAIACEAFKLLGYGILAGSLYELSKNISVPESYDPHMAHLFLPGKF